MEPEKACKFRMPFGKYQGQCLDIIVTTDPKGAEYLDWMVGLKDLDSNLKEALECFLAIHWVKELVDRAVEDHHRGVRTEPVENLKKPKNWWEK